MAGEKSLMLLLSQSVTALGKVAVMYTFYCRPEFCVANAI